MPFYSSLELYSEKDARLQSRTVTFFAAQISISIHIYGAAPAVRFGKAVSNLQVKEKQRSPGVQKIRFRGSCFWMYCFPNMNHLIQVIS
mgnify:FL=1